MDAELAALAASGAAAVVGAMATDGWEHARGGMGRLLGRGRERRQAAIEALLDDDARSLAEGGGGRETDEAALLRARESLAARWREQVEALLTDVPEAAAELRALTARLAERSAGDGPGPRTPRTVRQENTAHHGGTVYAVLNGNLHIARDAPGETPEAG